VQEYSIAFIFEVRSDNTAPLNAVLSITDANKISLAGGPVQIQPWGGAPATPPLAYLNVKENGINLLAGANPSGEQQALEVVVAVIPAGASMTVNFTYVDVTVLGYYRFLGGSGQVALKVGKNVITFPE
jgi:hypothetical protein